MHTVLKYRYYLVDGLYCRIEESSGIAQGQVKGHGFVAVDSRAIECAGIPITAEVFNRGLLADDGVENGQITKLPPAPGKTRPRYRDNVSGAIMSERRFIVRIELGEYTDYVIKRDDKCKIPVRCEK